MKTLTSIYKSILVLTLLVFCSLTGLAQTVPAEEKNALIALYNATDGANWTNTTNWLSANPVGTWYGVTVANGHVTAIDFSSAGNKLNGSLPVELGDLNFLEIFNVSANSSLVGNIIPELFTNTKLTEVDLSNNKLTGPIPSNVSNLTELRSLELDYNDLSGNIPSEIYSLVNLEVLNLFRNSLTGTIPTDIQNLTKLTDLSLGNNPLTGSIPAEVGSLINLNYLNLSQTDLTGPIPSEIGNLTNLHLLQLSRNKLSGSIPPSLGNLSEVTNFNLFSNELTGSIPASLGNLTNVKSFLINTNQLTGAIPSELGNLVNAESFYLGTNMLSGSIPSELGNLIKVKQFYLGDNQLTGTIPTSLATLPNVEDIFFFGNNLSGTLPDFTQAPNLDYRILIRNNAFQFGDFENQWNAYQTQLTFFTISPQDRVNAEETISKNIGSDITLTTTVSGSQNKYQWYKNNALIDGETSSDLILNNAQPSASGTYHCLITSDIVTDLTLRRNNISLTVLDTDPPVLTCSASQTIPCNSAAIPDFTTLITVSDTVDPNPTIVQDPVIGSPFVFGMTVTITATDDNDNMSECSFVVTDTSTPVEAGNDATIILGESTQLTAASSSSSGSYLWSPSEGLSDITIANPIATPLETTTYKVIFTNEDDCESEDEITITVNDAITSTVEGEFDQQIKIYPNPGSSTAQIDFGRGSMKNVNVRFVDLAGKDVIDRYYPTVTDLIQIDVDKLDIGIYLIEIREEKNTSYKRFIKN